MREVTVTDIISGEIVTNIVSDLTGLLECCTACGQQLSICGSFAQKGLEINNNECTFWGVFRGSIEVAGKLVAIEVHFKNDSGVIVIVDVEEFTPTLELTEFNTCFAKLKLPSGQERVVVRDLSLPWEPQQGYLAGFVGSQKILFIVQ